MISMKPRNKKPLNVFILTHAYSDLTIGRESKIVYEFFKIISFLYYQKDF